LPDELAAIRTMDKPANMQSLADLGRAAARKPVKEKHFAAAFDLA